MGRLNYDSAPVRNIPTATPGDSSSTPASTAFVQNAVPAGVVLPYAGPVPPAGWLLCDGSNVSRTTYAKLFAAVGTTYGVGDGSTTFKLPDLRGEFVRGLDNARGVDAARTLGSAQTDTMQQVTGTLLSRTGTAAIGAITASTGPFSTAVKAGTPGAPLTFDPSNQNLDVTTFDLSKSARTSTETRPRNVAMNYIIKFA
ncbi:MAG TPA: phage tail protein [Burkholderiaceae bacterium]|nr:phage tail protein [Burkholderiaceae bacterium]